MASPNTAMPIMPRLFGSVGDPNLGTVTTNMPMAPTMSTTLVSHPPSML